MEKEKWSKAFTAYKEFSDAVRADESNKTADGKNKYNVYGFKDYTTKDGKKASEFVLGAKGCENLRFNISENGVLKGVEYIDWRGVADGSAPARKEYVGKDFEKLAGLVGDKLLTDMASKFDWAYAPKKEATAAEAEADDIELE